jgi:hypothetical protein
MAGYRFVDNLLAQRVDLLAMSNLKLFLELNALVLCGHDQGARAPRPTSRLPNGGFMIRRAAAYAMSSSGTRFTGPTRCGGGLPGCISTFSANLSCLSRASPHQRTGFELYSRARGSASLCADGRECKGESRSLNPDHRDPKTHSLVALFRIPKIKRHFAKFLKEQSDRNYLIATSAGPVAGSA